MTIITEELFTSSDIDLIRVCRYHNEYSVLFSNGFDCWPSK